MVIGGRSKADLITIDNDGQYVIIDLKTTGSNPSDINIFRMRDFGYDSQCYLYKELFGMDFKFIFFGKKQKINESGDIYYDIEEITPSEDTIESGKMAVMNALANYNKFFWGRCNTRCAKVVHEKSNLNIYIYEL